MDIGGEDFRTHKLPITLPEELYSFLVEGGLRSFKSGGKRLSQTAIIRAALSALAEADFDFTALNGEEDLKNRIVAAIKAR